MIYKINKILFMVHTAQAHFLVPMLQHGNACSDAPASRTLTIRYVQSTFSSVLGGQNLSASACSRSHSWRFLRSIGFVLLLSAALLFSSLASGEDTVATVNDESITVREFQRVLYRKRAEVLRYFRQKHGARDEKGFWDRDHGGEVPIEKLRSITLDDCVRTKVQLIMACKHDLVEDASYAAFLSSLKRENARRKKAVANGEVIFGPIEYTEDTGFAHFFSRLLISLKRSFARKNLTITDEVLREFYDENREVYKRSDDIKVHALTVEATGDGGRADPVLKRAAKSRIEQLASARSSGETLKQLHARMGDGVNFVEQIIGDTDQSEGASEEFDISEVVRDMKQGEVSGVVEQGDAYSLVECVERKDGGYYPFNDQLKQHLRDMYVDSAYEKKVDELVADAKISVKERIYGSLRLR